MSRAQAALATLLCAALLTTACSGSKDTPTTKGTPSPEPVEACQPGTLEDIDVSGPFGQEPTVVLHDEISVEESKCAVLTEGSGPRAAQDDVVELQFVLINGRTKTLYGSSYKDPGVKEVRVDKYATSRAIRGVRQLVQGAQVGSRIAIEMSPEDGKLGGDPENGLKDTDSLIMVADILKIRDVLERADGTAQPQDPSLPTVTLADNGTPTITVPKTPAPTQLVSELLIEGNGAVINAGQELTARYSVVDWATGRAIETNWGNTAGIRDLVVNPDPTLGLPAGWIHAIPGLKVGSQLLLVLPPSEAYGSAGYPALKIGPTDTLVYVIDLLAARDVPAE